MRYNEHINQLWNKNGVMHTFIAVTNNLILFMIYTLQVKGTNNIWLRIKSTK